MTAQQTERFDAPRITSTKSAGKAYQRRQRRQQPPPGRRLTATGSPIAAALTRVPFVALVILLLAGGIVGVLWLNTMSDAAGLRASQSRLDQMDLTTKIQAASQEVAAMQDPVRLAAEARALGLVPPGDAAMLEVGADGRGTVIGTPTPVPAAAPTRAAPAPVGAATSAAATTAAQTTAAQTTAAQTTAAKTTAAKTTAAKTTAAKTSPLKTTPLKSTPLKSTPLKSTPPKSPAPTTTPARATAPTTGA